MAGKADLVIYQGDDWAAVVTVTDGSGQPADLTGYTAQAQIRSGPADQSSTVVAEISTTVDAANSAIDLSIPHATTVQMAGFYVWDLQVTDGAGMVTTLLAGNVAVTKEVTREGAAA